MHRRLVRSPALTRLHPISPLRPEHSPPTLDIPFRSTIPFSRYGYKDDVTCSACEGDIGAAFVPLILLVLVLLIGLISFLRGGSAVNLETLVEGGAEAAVKEAMAAKRDQMMDATTEKAASASRGTSRKERAMAKTLKAVGLARKIALVVQKASVKIKILFSRTPAHGDSMWIGVYARSFCFLTTVLLRLLRLQSGRSCQASAPHSPSPSR